MVHGKKFYSKVWSSLELNNFCLMGGQEGGMVELLSLEIYELRMDLYLSLTKSFTLKLLFKNILTPRPNEFQVWGIILMKRKE